VECAFVYPATFLFILAIIIGGMGMFRYQQISWLARQGSHYASVRGTTYASDTGNTAATQTSIDTYVKAQAASLDNSNLTVTMSPTTAGATGSTLTVTVSYQWFPEAYLVGPITLTSTSKMTVAY